MSDRFPVVIHIGGAVRRSVVKELIQFINSEVLQQDYGTPLPRIDSEEELLKYKEKGALVFYDDERAWGCFEDLEAFLVKRRIPFDRHQSPRYEYLGELVQYRQGMKWPQTAITGDDWNILVQACEVQEIRNMLRKSQSAGTARRALKKLNALCVDLDVEPLPEFQIID